MVIGRILGTLIAVLLAAGIHNQNYFWEIVLLLAFTAIGVAVGILSSLFLGLNFETDQPLAQDSLNYWVEKYGEPLGTEAYAIWLEELDRTGEDTTSTTI